MSKYEKTLDDELDWNLLNQLHNVVLQLSSFTFYTKQICLTVEVGVVGILIKLADDKLNASIFIASLVIALCFWLLDSIGYYYQVKIRSVMDNIREKIRERNSEKIVYSNNFQRVIEKERSTQPQKRQLFNSFFNNSMWLYYILIIVISILWFFFSIGWIF